MKTPRRRWPNENQTISKSRFIVFTACEVRVFGVFSPLLVRHTSGLFRYTLASRSSDRLVASLDIRDCRVGCNWPDMPFLLVCKCGRDIGRFNLTATKLTVTSDHQ